MRARVAKVDVLICNKSYNTDLFNYIYDKFKDMMLEDMQE